MLVEPTNFARKRQGEDGPGKAMSVKPFSGNKKKSKV
jgi:hypothetical protein